ncbi:hypothetical protein Indivirus_10_10 [Indivirus ILV1]|uniref:C3H1-type domain-containing protein n=1 Tax=Indivirus ILV1 TaxID=1977633 RepID=A0A1V0SE96_9VIRU|nr:hypothetical protein Indivirus_10_10 [Indivirus ILV1]
MKNANMNMNWHGQNHMNMNWHGQNHMNMNWHGQNQMNQMQQYNWHGQNQQYQQYQQYQMEQHKIQEQIRLHNQKVFEYQMKEDLKKKEFEKIELERKEIYKKMEDKKYRDSLNVMTELCETYIKGKRCYKKYCAFAHSKAELKIKKCGYEKFCNCIEYKNNTCENKSDIICLKLHETIESEDDYYKRCNLINPNNDKIIIILEDDDTDIEDDSEVSDNDTEYELWKNDRLIEYENDYKKIKSNILRSDMIHEMINEMIYEMLSEAELLMISEPELLLHL